MAIETSMKFGFIKDENNFQLKETLKNNFKIKEIHIDIYPENPIITPTMPFMLLLRTIENNLTVVNDGNRLKLNKNDKYNTCFMNVLFSNVTECYYKILDNCFEFILNIKNIYYMVTILN